MNHTATKPKQHDQHSTKVFIPYYRHINKQVKNILHCHSVSTACTSNKSLRDLLTSTESRQPVVNTSNVIYQIPCKDCLSACCGQTSRLLYKRISEHERYTNATYSQSTDLQQSFALAHHAHSSGHSIYFYSTVILAKLQQLDLAEHTTITHLSAELNRNHAAPNINVQWQPILASICESFKPSGIST